MELQDKSIKCFDCGEIFVFTTSEQEAFLAQGRNNSPKRCPACREARKTRQLKTGNYRNIQPGFYTERKLYPATCAQCGQSTQVPFEPKAGRPVFCRECYHGVKVNR